MLDERLSTNATDSIIRTNITAQKGTLTNQIESTCSVRRIIGKDKRNNKEKVYFDPKKINILYLLLSDWLTYDLKIWGLIASARDCVSDVIAFKTEVDIAYAAFVAVEKNILIAIFIPWVLQT